MPLRIAMWSGPRNISTAMMRAFGNRSDTVVCDEPLYAFYLQSTGAKHPGADEIIAHCETDWRQVALDLTGPVPSGADVYFQKQMAHHLLPELERAWLWRLEHAFLIRDPREMLLSLSRVTPYPSLNDTGLPQQLELFQQVKERTGKTPSVLDAKDVCDDPRGQLTLLCESVGLPFQEEMLSWPAGPRDTDGIWARHWYGSLLRSTGFRPWKPRAGELSSGLDAVLERCRPIYEVLHAHRLAS